MRAAGFTVVPIPGPSAVTAAISVSGFPADRYLFLGFAPRKGPERALGGAAGRQGCVGREITKLYEEFRVGSLEYLATWAAEHPPRGEVTLVLAPAPEVSEAGPDPDAARQLATELLAAGRSKRDVVREVADRTGLPRNTVYDLVMELSAGS